MRIVYDDEKQADAISVFENFILKKMNIKKLIKYSNGMERVDSDLFKGILSKEFSKHQFEIGNTVTHYAGIGNNCQYPVYYNGDPTEKQQVGYININHGMYGEMYTYLSDYNQEDVTDPYEIRNWGIFVHNNCIKKIA